MDSNKQPLRRSPRLKTPSKTQEYQPSSPSPSPTLCKQALVASASKNGDNVSSGPKPKPIKANSTSALPQANLVMTFEVQSRSTASLARLALCRQVESAPETNRTYPFEKLDDSPTPTTERNSNFRAPCNASFARLTSMNKHMLTCRKCSDMSAEDMNTGQALKTNQDGLGRKDQMKSGIEKEEVRVTEMKSKLKDGVSDEGKGIGATTEPPEDGHNASAHLRTRTTRPSDELNTSGESRTNDPEGVLLEADTSATTSDPFSDVPNRSNISPGSKNQIASEKPVEDKLFYGLSEVYPKIRAVLESDLTPEDDFGYVYVFSDPARKNLRKIGMSLQTQNRMLQIREKCGIELKFIHERKVDYRKRAESLIHAEFSNLRHLHPCKKCSTVHREWFEVDDKLSINAIERWADFIDEKNPYESVSRKLLPFWKKWIRNRAPRSSTEGLDCSSLHLFWTPVLFPSLLDRLTYHTDVLRAHAVWTSLWTFSWQVNALIAWITAYGYSANRATFLAFLVSSACTFITMSSSIQEIQKSRKPAATPRKEKGGESTPTKNVQPQPQPKNQ